MPIIGFRCSVWRWKVALAVVRRTFSRGKCRDICGHGCVDWESHRLWFARCYSFSVGQWGLRLSCPRDKFSRGIFLLHGNAHPHTARQTQTLLREQFHWDIFEHPPSRTVRTWHRRTFSCFQKWRSTLLVKALEIMKTWRMLSAATWYDEGIHKLVASYDKCLNVKGD